MRTESNEGGTQRRHTTCSVQTKPGRGFGYVSAQEEEPMLSSARTPWRRAGTLLSVLVLALAACTGAETPTPTATGTSAATDGGPVDIGEVPMVSSQLVPV